MQAASASAAIDLVHYAVRTTSVYQQLRATSVRGTARRYCRKPHGTRLCSHTTYSCASPQSHPRQQHSHQQHQRQQQRLRRPARLRAASAPCEPVWWLRRWRASASAEVHVQLQRPAIAGGDFEGWRCRGRDALDASAPAANTALAAATQAGTDAAAGSAAGGAGGGAAAGRRGGRAAARVGSGDGRARGEAATRRCPSRPDPMHGRVRCG
eukprot:365025-Chlamydomonas_euryale.AAC.20